MLQKIQCEKRNEITDPAIAHASSITESQSVARSLAQFKRHIASGRQKSFDGIPINAAFTAPAFAIVIAHSKNDQKWDIFSRGSIKYYIPGGLTQGHASGGTSPISESASKSSLTEAES